ncbi:MAG: PQQ-like beta-propeller repeat protein [Anaerolineales bacterium]|nr:PQQ-like beta-propeller repeat protein [Anaerolineales bacterium]
MKTKKMILISLLVLGAMFLSACSGGTVVNNWYGLAADAERAYVSAGSFIYAVDLQNGSEVWRYPEKADSKVLFFANPVLTTDGQLLIGSAGAKDHKFISLDPATGKEKWAKVFTGAKGAWVAAPLVMNDRIYVPNTDGFLYVLDLSGNQSADPIDIGGALWSAPVSDGTLIYLSSLDHFLHIIDPVKGVVVSEIDLGGAIPSSPAVNNIGAYAGSFASTIEFIQSNGDHSVLTQTENRVWGSPVLDGETLYYADLNGKVYSFDLASGTENWSVQPDGPVAAGLLIAGGQIYVASEADPTSELGTLVALDLDGKTVWSKEVGGKLYTTPVVSGDLILVAPHQAEVTLAAYDADGKQAWTFTPAK